MKPPIWAKTFDGECIPSVSQIVDVRTGDIYAYEALMRPYKSDLKSPVEVLAIARAQGKLSQIEQLTWFMAMEKFASCCDSMGGTFRLFINSIPNCLLDSQDCQTLKEQYPELLHRVVLELTEDERSDVVKTSEKLSLVRSMSVKIAIDDYGAGYNTQRLLIDSSPDYVKIDMNIIRGIDADASRQETVRNLLAYTKPRGILVIAEGIETERELNYIRSAGVDFAQGYLIQPPAKNLTPLSSDVLKLMRQDDAVPSAARGK